MTPRIRMEPQFGILRQAGDNVETGLNVHRADDRAEQKLRQRCHGHFPAAVTAGFGDLVLAQHRPENDFHIVRFHPQDAVFLQA